MALDPVVNFFRSTIATLPVASGGTSIVLQTGDGNKLPAPAIDGAFNLTIYNADDPFVAPEIVRVTARSGDTLTVTRAQEGTSATNKTAGSTWNVELTPTAKTIQDIDSAKLDVAGGTMTGDLTIPDKIIHSGDTNTAIRFPANDTVSVETAGSEALRVDSSGNVGIGVTSPNARVDVSATNSDETVAVFKSLSYNNAGITLGYAPGSGGPNYATFAGYQENNGTVSGSNYGAIIGLNTFYNGTNYLSKNRFLPMSSMLFLNGTIRLFTDAALNPSTDPIFTPSERIRITSAGNVGIGKTAPATKLDVDGSIRASTGILFGTDTASANTLDDYEEGTWTATLISGATTQPTGLTLGRYTKIGRVVHCVISTTFGSITVNGTHIKISGLPFASGYANQVGNIGISARITYQASSNHCWQVANSTELHGQYISADTGNASNLLTQASGTFTPNITVNITYTV